MTLRLPRVVSDIPEAPALQATPPVEIIALNRMAYGPRPGDVERVQAMGLTAYVDEQLNPSANPADDSTCTERLNAARLRITYTRSDGTRVDEMRPLRTITENWNLEQLYAIRQQNGNEHARPIEEVRAATWIRAIYSKWQLREVLVEFWHNHFNVDSQRDLGSGARISTTWPLYDAIMRRHALGNFRAFLEDVAQSIAMLIYLDNATSRDGPANENYARELFELHGMGASNYLNDLYDRWRDVPGATATPPAPVGYIDQDVYEAARAFTGWTLEMGQTIVSNQRLPDTGKFAYVERWHDNAQKRVLATEFDSNRPAMEDGRRVFDLIAAHPGTARFICEKLCRRLVSDTPPQALVERAAAAWLAAKDAPDQIKQVVRLILLSPEFAATWGAKVKRPFDMMAAFLRATSADVTPNSNLFSAVAAMGYTHFTWAPPTGLPEAGSYWLSTAFMLRRWNTLLGLFGNNSGGYATFALQGQIPAGVTSSRQIVEFWVNRLLGRPAEATTLNRLLDFMRQNQPADAPPTGTAADITSRINNLVALIGMSPEFQQK
ncbi:MAG: DUF1800 domain-containing protein [Chloroflexaceae bacterium]|jgi:uncharacterized protein (DUF1800 family)|nr:DUF1800 domain-containing protein [Chloroflexaceae bacterium]